MFVLKSLGRLILGNTETSDLLAIPNGRLYTRTEGEDSRKNEVYFNSAKLVLQRGTAPHTYTLFVEDEEREESTEAFSVTTEMKFKRVHAVGGVSNHGGFEWKSGELSFQFQFSDDTLMTTIEMFHVTMAQCLYECDRKKSHTTASDTDIRKYMITMGAPEGKKKDERKDAETVVFESSTPAGWFAFDPNTALFVPRLEACWPRVTRESVPGTKLHKFYLVVRGEPSGGIRENEEKTVGSPSKKKELVELHRQLIDPDATHHTDRISFSYVWCFLSDSAYIWTFSLRFESAAAVMALSNAIGQAIYEILNEEKMKAEDSEYLLNPFVANDIEMGEPPVEVVSEASGSETESDHEMVDIGAKEEEFSNLAVGYKHDRSFVSKGSTLGVFKHTADDRLEPYTTIDAGFTTLTGGRAFAPTTMMLHQEDSSLLLMNPEDRQHIYKMDLERGKIVEEWGVAEDTPVTAILPSAKYSQMTSEATLIGLNDSSLFRLDPRLSGKNKRVETETKSYVVKNRFSCGTTTGKGELAVASAKGDIRLFNKLDKRAKTLLPGFGDPIIGIDVTESGRWIVATCRTYLLLINTEIQGTEGTLGFTKSMGADSKPKPIRLTLRPEHVAYMGQPLSFTPARFSTGQSEERSIITSTGPFVVSWNFRRVKQGHLFDYQLKRYSETVVADNFRFGQDRAMIVALPHHVTMMTKKSLSAPSPRVLRPRPEDVVDAPF